MFRLSSTEIKKLEMSLFDKGIGDFTNWEEEPYWVRIMDKLMLKVGEGTIGMEGKIFLEVGCGRSVYMPIAHHNGMNVAGLDISNGFLRLNTSSEKVWADAESLPFCDNSVDYLLCVGVIHHVPDKEKMVKEIMRVTKDKFLIIEPHSMSINWIYRWFRMVLIRILGWEKVLSLIGFGTPYESFISRGLIVKNLSLKFDLQCELYNPFRVPPFKFLKKRVNSDKLNGFLEKIPLIRNFGTYILFHGGVK